MFPKRILQLIMHAAGKGKGGKGGKGQPTALTAAQTTALAARASPNLSSPDDVKKQKMFGKYTRRGMAPQHTPARPGKIPVTGPPLVIAWGNGPGVILAKSRTGKHLGEGRWAKAR